MRPYSKKSLIRITDTAATAMMRRHSTNALIFAAEYYYYTLDICTCILREKKTCRFVNKSAFRFHHRSHLPHSARNLVGRDFDQLWPYTERSGYISSTAACCILNFYEYLWRPIRTERQSVVAAAARADVPTDLGASWKCWLPQLLMGAARRFGGGERSGRCAGAIRNSTVYRQCKRAVRAQPTRYISSLIAAYCGEKGAMGSVGELMRLGADARLREEREGVTPIGLAESCSPPNCVARSARHTHIFFASFTFIDTTILFLRPNFRT